MDLRIQAKSTTLEEFKQEVAELFNVEFDSIAEVEYSGSVFANTEYYGLVQFENYLVYDWNGVVYLMVRDRSEWLEGAYRHALNQWRSLEKKYASKDGTSKLIAKYRKAQKSLKEIRVAYQNLRKSTKRSSSALLLADERILCLEERNRSILAAALKVSTFLSTFSVKLGRREDVSDDIAVTVSKLAVFLSEELKSIEKLR